MEENIAMITSKKINLESKSIDEQIEKELTLILNNK